MSIIQKKVCMLGDFAVGKTSLVKRFVEGKFDDKYLSSIGVNVKRKRIPLEDKIFNLIIWDLAGGDEFLRSNAGYLRGAAGALLICDLTRRSTLQTVEQYAQQVRALNPDTSLILIGNKVDLTDDLRLLPEELSELATELNCPYHLTSAKTGNAVELAFTDLVNQIVVQS